jgi:hypothetical protein
MRKIRHFSSEAYLIRKNSLLLAGNIFILIGIQEKGVSRSLIIFGYMPMTYDFLNTSNELHDILSFLGLMRWNYNLIPQSIPKACSWVALLFFS